MKQISIVGNLGANAVLRTTADGKQIMTFNVAVDQGEKFPALWFGCVSNYREKLMPYLVKGQCVCIVGDLQPSVYNGKLSLTVNVDRFALCGSAPAQNSPLTQPVDNYDFDSGNQPTL